MNTNIKENDTTGVYICIYNRRHTVVPYSKKDEEKRTVYTSTS